MAKSKKDPFFIGYLPAPAALVAFNIKIIVAIMLLGFGAGFWIASGQKSGGPGAVDKTQVELTGFLTMDPYPVLHHVDGADRSVLLIDKMKKSADRMVKNYADQWITVSGAKVRRGDWEMLVLAPGTEVAIATSKSDVTLEDVELGDVSLNGEIIDSKCYLGAMKPAGGKVHRSCARLCLLGGVPPMFVAKNVDGTRYGYLLMKPDGSSASLDLSDKVAKPVTIEGTIIKRGAMQLIRLDTEKVEYLAGRELKTYGQTLEQESMARANMGVAGSPVVCSARPLAEGIAASRGG